MHDYKKLKVWNQGMDLIEDVYEMVAPFPKSEMYGLTSQIKRSVISIPANVAEGAGRFPQKSFRNFVSIANGSCYELETHLIAANRLRFLPDKDYRYLDERVNHIQRMLWNFHRSME